MKPPLIFWKLQVVQQREGKWNNWSEGWGPRSEKGKMQDEQQPNQASYMLL